MSDGAGVLLLAAVGGFWVLERSASHRGRLKQIGQLLGGAIIIVSLIGVGCRVWYLSTGKSSDYQSKKWHHYRHYPDTSSTPSPTQ